MRGKNFIRLIGLLVPLLFIFAFSNSVANADDNDQSSDNSQQLQTTNGSSQPLLDLNQYQSNSNNSSGDWNDSYGSINRSNVSLSDGTKITNVNDFDYGLSKTVQSKYNDLSEEQDWQRKIDPLGAYYASSIEKYVQKGYHIKIDTSNLDKASEDFSNYVKNKNLSLDYINYERLAEKPNDPGDFGYYKLDNSIKYITQNPVSMTDDINGTREVAQHHFDESSLSNDNLKFNGIKIRNTFGLGTEISTRDDHYFNSFNNESIKDYAGTYEGPIYMVTFTDMDKSWLGAQLNVYSIDWETIKSIAIPLDYLLFLPVKLYDENGNLVTNNVNKINNYHKKIDFISDSKIIKTQDITVHNDDSFTLEENDLQIPSGYKLAPWMSLHFQSQNHSSEYSVELEKDDSYTKPTTNDSHTGFLQSLGNAINGVKNTIIKGVHKIGDGIGEVFSDPVQATYNLFKTTAKQFVSFAKEVYKKSKDTVSYGIQSLINTFFNSTGNFNVKLLSKGAFKALSGAASMINKISNFKSNMIKGIVHGGISTAIKQSLKDFKANISAKLKDLASINLRTIVDKISAVKNYPKKFIYNVKIFTRNIKTSINSVKELMKNETAFINSVIGSVGNNPYILGKLNAVKIGLDTQMKYINQYQSQDNAKNYSEAKRAYSNFQKIVGIKKSVINSFKNIKAALNPQTNQVVKWLKQYSDNGMAFGFTRKNNLLTMVTPWGDFKFNYHYKKLKQTLYNKFIITKEVIKTIVGTGFTAAGNLLESAADNMISAFPEGLIGTVLIYGLVEGFRDFGLQDKVENGITDSVYGSIGNKEYTDKEIADHLNPLALINF